MATDAADRAAHSFLDRLREFTGIDFDPMTFKQFVCEHWVEVGPMLQTMSGERPHFTNGTVVADQPALVVDIGGTAWWVDPQNQTIKRADAR